MKLKIVPQGISVFGKVGRNWMDAHLMAGGEPISLLSGERTGPSWVGLFTLMGLPFPCHLCWGHFPAWAGGGSIFWSVELSLWRLKLQILRGLPRIFSGQATQERVWSEAVSTLHDILQVWIWCWFFSLSIFSCWLTAPLPCFCFFFCSFFPCHLRPSGPRITSWLRWVHRWWHEEWLKWYQDFAWIFFETIIKRKLKKRG